MNLLLLGAGCLEPSIKDKFVVVKKAVRDEGVSYHYLNPATYVETDDSINKELECFLKNKGFEFFNGITWTTDAYYRETKQKIEMAKALGAISVEMECASWSAVAKYRGFKFSQILYFSDLVKQDAWSRLIELSNGYHTEKKDIIVLLVKEMIEYYSK